MPSTVEKATALVFWCKVNKQQCSALSYHFFSLTLNYNPQGVKVLVYWIPDKL